MSAGAAYRYGQTVFSFLNVAGNQLFDEFGSSVDKLLGNVVFQDVLGDLLVVSRQLFEAWHVVRVGDKAHVQGPVGFDWNSVFIAEGHNIEHECAVLAAFGEKPVQLGIHLRHFQRRCVYDVVGIGSQFAELSALLLYDLFGYGRCGKGMCPAGLVVSSDEDLVGCLYEKDFEVHIPVCLQRCYAAL